jgi:hypothetical protein
MGKKRTFGCLIMNIPPLRGTFCARRHLKHIKVTLWGITHYSRHIPHIWRHVSPLRRTFGGKDTLFNPFSHIWRHISPFEVFGGKDTLFKAFSTYLEACFTFEEGFGVRTLCSRHFLHIWRKDLCMRRCHVALLTWSNPQMNNKCMF